MLTFIGVRVLALRLSSVSVCFTLWPDPRLESSGTGGTLLDGLAKDLKFEISWQICVPNNAPPPDAILSSGHVVGAVTCYIEGHVR